MYYFLVNLSTFTFLNVNDFSDLSLAYTIWIVRTDFSVVCHTKTPSEITKEIISNFYRKKENLDEDEIILNFCHHIINNLFQSCSVFLVILFIYWKLEISNISLNKIWLSKKFKKCLHVIDKVIMLITKINWKWGSLKCP